MKYDDIVSQAAAIMEAESARLAASGGVDPKRRRSDWKSENLEEGIRRHPLRRHTEGLWEPPVV